MTKSATDHPASQSVTPQPPVSSQGTYEFDLDSLLTELDLDWDEASVRALKEELRPWTEALYDLVESGESLPSHVPGAFAVAVPIGPITDPQELFNATDGDVQGHDFTITDRGFYWVTIHHSTVPVVMIVLKEVPDSLPRLEDLCRRCEEIVGAPVGGPTGMYLQWNQAGFHWQLHTDDEWEGVARRIHVPLDTSPQSWFAFADRLDREYGDWVLCRHLPRGGVYLTRVDVPHTAGNDHPRDGRLHLILDVEGPAV